MTWHLLPSRAWFQRVGYYTTVASIYGGTVVFLLFVGTAPARALAHERLVQSAMSIPLSIATPSPTYTVPVVSGRPIRIVIPALGIDLSLDPGYYDSATGTWNLSGYRAQFAMSSSLANNVSGDTFVYGHNNNYVFGALRHHTPAAHALALLYTNNGHILEYSFISTSSYVPTDTSVLSYNGPSRLTIQTCTGSFNEWRTMYYFAFKGVQQ